MQSLPVAPRQLHASAARHTVSPAPARRRAPRGRPRRWRRRFEQAEADCNRALSFDLSSADRVKALLRRGTARQHLYRVPEAAEDFRAALKLEPNNRQAREELRVSGCARVGAAWARSVAAAGRMQTPVAPSAPQQTPFAVPCCPLTAARLPMPLSRQAIKQQEDELAAAQRAALMQQRGPGGAAAAGAAFAGLPGGGAGGEGGGGEAGGFLDAEEYQRLLSSGQVPVLLGERGGQLGLRAGLLGCG